MSIGTEDIDRNEGLSEEQVKRRFAAFLRAFYRDRFEPLPNSIETSLDNVGAGGIVADGIMRFRKSDGTPFTCAYEATSRDKAEEVKFALNLVYFLWDCAAFGMVCAAFACLVAFVANLKWLISLHGIGIFGFLLGVGMIGFFAWYFTLNKWRKYRYIYAIQQFKQYAADEQWIALAEDVFPSPIDPYLLELRQQCVFSGFGLAIVSLDAETRVLCAPTRLRIYGEGRKMIHWLTRAQWYQQMTGGAGDNFHIPLPNAWTAMVNLISRPFRFYFWDPVQKQIWGLLSRPFGHTASAYHRFMRGQTTQKFVFLFALSICTYLSYQVLSIQDENIADLEIFKNWRAKPNPEDQPNFNIQGSTIPYDGKYTGVPKQYPQTEEDVETIDLTAGIEDEVKATRLPVAKPPAASSSGKVTKILSPKPVEKPKVIDGCAAIKGKAGWMIQDNVFSNRDFTTRRVAALKAGNIPCSWAAQSCLNAGAEGFFIWLGDIYNDVGAARKKVTELEKAMKKAGLLRGRLLVRKI